MFLKMYHFMFAHFFDFIRLQNYLNASIYKSKRGLAQIVRQGQS